MAVNSTQRGKFIVDSLIEAFEPLMKADPDAFRTKFRKMAAEPFAFYRGSACVFYGDMAKEKDKYADDKTSRIWIHGDLHAENFGTYMNSEGILTFDVNDFDEAYVGHFSWDLRRFLASLALMGWQKALPDDEVRRLSEIYLKAYVEQVQHYVGEPHDHVYALRLDNTEGALHEVLRDARMSTRVGLLDKLTEMKDFDRRLRRSRSTRDLSKAERRKVEKAYEQYLTTIPSAKREHRDVFYRVKDVVGKKGFGIGSAGLPAYTLLIEGFNQALENDIVLSMKQGNIPAVSRVLDLPDVEKFFDHEGHRTVVSQRALQVHADAFLGHTTVDGVGFVVSEVSPYEADLDWSEITEPEEMAPVLDALGRATAKIHCVADDDSEEDLVTFSTEHAIAEAIGTDEDAFIKHLVDFALRYAVKARKDHALFVEAFRGGAFDLVSAT